MAVIINRPAIVRKRTDKVVVSPTGKLYDSNNVVVVEKTPDTILEVTAANIDSQPGMAEPAEVSITTTMADVPVDEPETAPEAETTFSWQGNTSNTESPPEAPPETKYVVVEDGEVVKPPVEKPKKKTNPLDVITAVVVGTAAVAGGKTGFDYVQESESIRQINQQLEQEISEIEKRRIKEENISASEVTERNIRGEPPQYPANPNDDNWAQAAGIPAHGFVKIIQAKPYYLLVERRDGKIELRTGGSIGWRTNNPAEFGYGDFAQQTGAIGNYENYAVFPSKERGIQAVDIYLFSTNRFANLSINDAMQKFYSKSKAKAERVARRISVALDKSRFNTKMIDLSRGQRELVLKEILKEDAALSGLVRLYNNIDQFKSEGF